MLKRYASLVVGLLLPCSPLLLSCTGTSSETSATDTNSGETAGADGRVGTDALSDQGPCAPQCTNRECGDDGCGGQCGTCEGAAWCNQGLCTTAPPDTLCDYVDDHRSGDLGAEGLFETSTWDAGGEAITDGYSYDAGTYDAGSYDPGYPDSGYWDGGTWDTHPYYDGWTMDGWSWDGYAWDGAAWEGYNWDGVSWEGYAWDGYAWEGYNWDGMDFDWGKLPEIGTVDCGDIDEEGTCEGNVLKYCVFGEVVEEDCKDNGPNWCCVYDEEWQWYACMPSC